MRTQKREKERGKRERDRRERVEGFVLINITSPARVAQLKFVSASAPPKYSYLSFFYHLFRHIPLVFSSPRYVLHLSLVDLSSASSTVESATEAFALQSQTAASSIALCFIVDTASVINDGPASRAARPQLKTAHSFAEIRVSRVAFCN